MGEEERGGDERVAVRNDYIHSTTRIAETELILPFLEVYCSPST
jgi:hypothetical protein